MRQRRRIHLKRDSGNAAQRFAMPHDPLGHFVRFPDKQRTVRSALGVEALAGNGTPAPFLGDAADGLGVAGEVVVAGLLARRRDITEGMDAYSPVSRNRSISGRKRRGSPPMMATIKASISAPARVLVVRNEEFTGRVPEPECSREEQH